MPNAVWHRTIVDEDGAVVQNATVTVQRRTAGLPLATITSDRDGFVNKINPFVTGPDGFAEFFAPGGAYKITVTKDSFTQVWDYEAIGTAAETDAFSIPTSVATGWRFDSSTTDADPGDGEFRLNNATASSATEIYIDNENDGENDVTAWLDSLDDFGDTSARGQLTICDPDQPTEVFHVYTVTGSVTDSSGYRTLTVTHVAGAGSFTDGVLYSFTFSSKGDPGDVPSSRTLTAGAGLTGGGTLAADRSFAVGAGTGITVNADDVAIDKASDANVRAAASNKVVTSDLIESASALVSLTDDTTIALDWDSGINFTVTVSGNRTLGNPTNGQPGTWRTVYVIGNDTSDRTLSFGNQYLGDVPSLTDIDSGQAYLLMIYCVTASHFIVSAKEAL